MKKKHRPVIPRFGRDKPPKGMPQRPDAESSHGHPKPAAPVRTANMKPQATSMKSGRRGQ